MLNIEIQCCALAVLIILVVLYRQERGLSLSSRKLYYYALLSSILCLALDILSIIGIYGATQGIIPPTVARIVCKLYVISLAFQTYQGFLYAASEFFVGGSRRGLRLMYMALFIVGAIAIAILPIDYLMDGRTVYSFGLSTTATYAVTLAFIVSTIVMAFKESDKSTKRRRRAILIWQGIWLLAAIIQMLKADLLLVGFATACGMVIIYAALENPQEGIDRVTGLFTANALTDYVSDVYLNHRKFCSLHIRLDQIERVNDPEKRKATIIRVANIFRSIPGLYAFRSSDREIVLIFDDKALLEQEYRRVREVFSKDVTASVRAGFIIVPDSSVVNNADEYFRVVSFFETGLESKDEIIVDENAVVTYNERAKVKELIQSAIEDDRVEVFYQPFYNVREKKFDAAEALVRIRDEKGDLVSPGKFIPVAEENGLIVPLGITIFRKVCAFLATGKPQSLGIKHIEINLSIAQFDNVNPARFVNENIKEFGIDPTNIALEITETASTTTKKFILKNMHDLISCGINFALDDFGTGRSNFDYFLEMPVNTIKFDHSFTQSYFKSDKAKVVLENTIGIMHSTGMAIVSEGVETQEQFEAMCRLGVDYIQGYYFSRPLPEKDFIEFLAKAA
ncbi:MAG: EAL domain-containing protein [Clostridia bacterium]|nr:EAL domain-containing protein [Clostridia bacterium]